LPKALISAIPAAVAVLGRGEQADDLDVVVVGQLVALPPVASHPLIIAALPATRTATPPNRATSR
jgi:hypothetical protein